jgi:mRNA interferase MazF
MRPAVILSADEFNASPAGLIVVAPMTTVSKSIPWHIQIDPPEGGVTRTSYIKVDDIRSVSTARLVRPWGILSIGTMGRVSAVMRILLHI